MRATILFALGICLSLSLTAQKVTVLHCSGQVNYFAQNNSTPRKLYPGLELPLDGRIRCNKGASAKLLYNRKSFLVKSTQIQDIKDIVGIEDKSASMSFGGRFLNFLTESMQESESTDKLQENHRRYMNKTTAAIKGYSAKDYSIPTDFLNIGVLPAERVIFKWRNSSGSGAYTFTLQDETGGTVAQLLVRDTFVTLDLSELMLDSQAEYQWQVSRNHNQDRSAPLAFRVDANSKSKALKAIDKTADYQAGDSAEQQLMLAYQFEQNQCFYNADELYRQLYKASPDNVLYRRLYSAFLMRTNRMEESIGMWKQ